MNNNWELTIPWTLLITADAICASSTMAALFVSKLLGFLPKFLCTATLSLVQCCCSIINLINEGDSDTQYNSFALLPLVNLCYPKLLSLLVIVIIKVLLIIFVYIVLSLFVMAPLSFWMLFADWPSMCYSSHLN